ncbi:MAG: YbhB/YbcL family Raf kinase inhibitor-like protein [Deltaproteobacteria bacterium]|nr:MAG: YbhB/YbcL family Raf kinase inhibitor-like protein [Deltaproteobacteria bacterium]
MHLRSDSFRPYDRLSSSLAFGEHDPDTHFTFAGNRNPHLAWSDVPEGTKSFALICVDHDVPSVGDDVNQEGRTVPVDLPRAPFYHWVLIDLPAHVREIAEGSHSEGVVAKGKGSGASPDGGLVGLNDYTNWFDGDPDMGGQYFGYDGPAPPWNDERMHGYRFQLFALDVPSLGLSGPFTGPDVLDAIEAHTLAKAEIMGLYAINPDV